MPATVNFIVGVEGSGTTMMSQIVSTPENAEVVLGNYNSLLRALDQGTALWSSLASETVQEELRVLLRQLEKVTATLWYTRSSVAQVTEAHKDFVRCLSELLAAEPLRNTSHIYLKRSAPFYAGNDYRPDLADVARLMPDAKIIVMTRDPRASTYSALARGFVDNIRHGALICEEQLLLLNARLHELPTDKYQVVSYEAFCKAPELELASLTSFLGLSQPLQLATDHIIETQRNDIWHRQLPAEEAEFLDGYFHRERLARMGLLNFE